MSAAINVVLQWSGQAGHYLFNANAPSDGVLAAAGGDDDELPSTARSIGHRRAVHAPRQRGVPHLGAGRRVDRVQREIAAAADHQAAGGRQHARRAGHTERGRQRDALQRRMPAQRRRVAERHAPLDRAAVQIDRHQMAVRRLEQRQAVHELRVGVADARELGVHFRRRAGSPPSVSGLPTRAMFAWFVVLTNSTPLDGSNAPPPQFAPPIRPGRCTVPCSDGGVNTGPMRYFASSCCAAAFSSGVEIERIVERDALFGDRRRPGRKRLRRPRVLARRRRSAAPAALRSARPACR